MTGTRPCTQNPTQFGLNAAAVAQQLGVGIEIDYEENTNPEPAVLCRHLSTPIVLFFPMMPRGNNHAARLTIDLGGGGPLVDCP